MDVFTARKRSLGKGNILQASVCPQGGGGLADPTIETATEAVSTHPTGMHSCLGIF